MIAITYLPVLSQQSINLTGSDGLAAHQALL